VRVVLCFCVCVQASVVRSDAKNISISIDRYIIYKYIYLYILRRSDHDDDDVLSSVVLYDDNIGNTRFLYPIRPKSVI